MTVSRGFFIDSPSMMVAEAKRLSFVFVEVAVAQEYLLNHLYKTGDSIEFKALEVPGVLMVVHKDDQDSTY